MQKDLVSKSRMLTNAAFIWLKNKYCKILEFKSWFLFGIYFKRSFHGKSFLQAVMSHDPSEIILIGWFSAQAKIHFLLSMLKAVVLLNIFVETMIQVLLSRILQAFIWNAFDQFKYQFN